MKNVKLDSEFDIYRMSLISDLYFFMDSILKNQLRYIYLNKRSIIENYIRIIKKIEDGRVTVSVFEEMNSNAYSEYSDYLSQGYYMFLKGEYSETCEYIHGGKKWQADLVEEYLSCCKVYSKVGYVLNNKESFYKNFYKIVRLLNMITFIEHYDNIISCFHRKTGVVQYLQGDKYCLLYDKIKNES